MDVYMIVRLSGIEGFESLGCARGILCFLSIFLLRLRLLLFSNFALLILMSLYACLLLALLLLFLALRICFLSFPSNFELGDSRFFVDDDSVGVCQDFLEGECGGVFYFSAVCVEDVVSDAGELLLEVAD